MAKVTIKLKGLEKTLKELNKRVSNAESATPKVLNDVALDLKGKSQARAPIDTGDLRGSAYAEIKGNKATVGFSSKYALIQHERLDFSHPQGGEAKYLENPLKENRDKYINHIKNSIKKAVE